MLQRRVLPINNVGVLHPNNDQPCSLWPRLSYQRRFVISPSRRKILTDQIPPVHGAAGQRTTPPELTPASTPNESGQESRIRPRVKYRVGPQRRASAGTRHSPAMSRDAQHIQLARPVPRGPGFRLSSLVQGGASGAAAACSDRQPKEHAGRAASGRSPRTPGCLGWAATTRRPRTTRCPRRAGRSPGWRGPGGRARLRLWLGGAIPSTSPRATRPKRGGKPGEVGWRLGRMLPPHCGLVGLRQVDGMALRPALWESRTDWRTCPSVKWPRPKSPAPAAQPV
jgi:hypothetical protein